MRIVGRTDQGRVRSNNEDFFAIDDVIGLAALADGMGGLNAGEVASEQAVDCIFEAFRRTARGNADLDLGGRATLLEAAVREANQRVYQLARSRLDYRGMGTTLVSASIRLAAFSLNPENALVDRALIDQAHDAGLAVYVFTVDDPGRMSTLIEWGVDGLFTNHPDRMRSLVGE